MFKDRFFNLDDNGNLLVNVAVGGGGGGGAVNIADPVTPAQKALVGWAGGLNVNIFGTGGNDVGTYGYSETEPNGGRAHLGVHAFALGFDSSDSRWYAPGCKASTPLGTERGLIVRPIPPFSYAEPTFATTGNSGPQLIAGGFGAWYSVQPIADGSVTAMAAVLEISNDGLSFVTLKSFTEADLNTLWTSAAGANLARFWRITVSSLTLNTATGVTFLTLAARSN
jgi:hypothetical protein